jgi:hypothetical protein
MKSRAWNMHGEIINTYKTSDGKPERKKSLGRPRRRR